MAMAECHSSSDLNSSSGGELKLYLKWKRDTITSVEKYPENTSMTLLEIAARVCWWLIKRHLSGYFVCFCPKFWEFLFMPAHTLLTLEVM